MLAPTANPIHAPLELSAARLVTHGANNPIENNKIQITPTLYCIQVIGKGNKKAEDM